MRKPGHVPRQLRLGLVDALVASRLAKPRVARDRPRAALVTFTTRGETLVAEPAGPQSDPVSCYRTSGHLDAPRKGRQNRPRHERPGARLRPGSRCPWPARPSRQLFPLKVTVCAWCGSRSIEGIWDEIDVVLHTFITGRRHLVTQGICPTCFEENLPGMPYPEA
jgi:hypothetical protein